MSESAEHLLRTQLEGLLESLLRFARSRAPDADFALDVSQEAVAAALAAARKGRRWEDAEALWMWLVGVIRNQTADEYRARGRRMPSLSGLGVAADAIAQPVATGCLPDELLVRREIQQLCRLAIDELPPRQRDALERFHWHGQSVREIADALATTHKAAESLLTRARAELYRVLTRNVADPEGLL